VTGCRVLLVNPPSPEQLGAPLLGQQYLAAALVRHGCEVRIIDAAARYFAHDADWIVDEADAFKPDIVGVALFTRWVWHAYQLVDRLRGRFPLLVAGGAHTTARPFEPLDHGFDVSIVGEAEESILQLVDAHLAGRSLSEVPGAVYRNADGSIRTGACAAAIADLDTLAFPQLAQPLYDKLWYDPSGREVIPGGMLTSRGCPARCTFCANYVTGRKFRHRRAECVVAELNAYHELSGACFFPCWDDALTADRRRLVSLCETIERDIRFPFAWSAITRATMVTSEVLHAMKRAGLVCVNFGVESGDDDILRAIKKGITTDHVVRALEMSKAEGLRTACNFMLGFPQETPDALDRTLRFMERIAPMVDTFSTLGVLVPFPGTPLYENYHEHYGFTDWWLREDHSHYEALPDIGDFDRFYRRYIDDANLELDFFHYSSDMRDGIRECLRFKGEHNLRMMGLLKDPVFRPEEAVA
jgi:anaerobic magnesium-protoporphyrin IX monomethyl ester cyclase